VVSEAPAFGPYVDPVNGFDFLSEAYVRTRPGYEERVS
jgi:hypothetical protein